MRIYRVVRDGLDCGVDRVEFYRHGDLICTVRGNTRATSEFIAALYFPDGVPEAVPA